MSNELAGAPGAPAGRPGIELEAGDLPAFCPNRKMTVWNQHPRVYLDLSHTGHALCPYCSTEYWLKPGTVTSGH